MYIVELEPFLETDTDLDNIERYNHLIHNLYNKPETGIILYGNKNRERLVSQVVTNGLLLDNQIISKLDDDSGDIIENLILENKKYIITIDSLDEIPVYLEGLYQTTIIVHSN